MKLNDDDIQKLAKTVKLEIDESSSAELSGQLSKTITYVEDLNRLDTSKTVPTYQTSGIKNVFREDKVVLGLSQKEALSGSKSTHRGYFKVKAIF